ncbi:MAG: nuclear transport factor 2 family protein [Terriglobia bacterium]
MIFKQLIRTLAVAGAAWVLVGAANAQQGKWAAPSDPTAKSLIDMERQWAEQECTHSAIEQTILADDFQGTTPEGNRYSKSQAVETSPPEAHECRLHDAQVHFFGENIAVVYGSESSIRKASDGKEYTRSLVWTDTWLKRNGKWQVVAAQDMRTDGK